MASKFFKAFKFFKGKVSPTIKSVKPTKDIAGSVKRVYRNETSKRIDAVSKAQNKMDTGRKMMREAKKEQKNLIDTGRAFQFKHSKGIHATRPGF
jgi:AAA15 family ATPase/GTPase